MDHAIHCGGEQIEVGEYWKTVFQFIQLKPKTTEMNNIVKGRKPFQTLHSFMKQK